MQQHYACYAAPIGVCILGSLGVIFSDLLLDYSSSYKVGCVVTNDEWTPCTATLEAFSAISIKLGDRNILTECSGFLSPRTGSYGLW